MTDKKKDSLEFFHNYGVYLPRRTVEIFGDIDEDMFEQTFKNLHILDETMDKTNPKNTEITVVINSEGGDVTQAKAIYDAIRSCQNDVRGIVYGEASSSASIILQACDKRIMAPNSYLMMHIGEEATAGHPENKKRWDEKHKLDQKWMEDVYLKSLKEKDPKFTRQKLQKMLTFDTILSPEEAKKIGLINEILETYD